MAATDKSQLIVYHTITGGILQMDRAAAAGAAQEAGVVITMLSASESGPAHALAADGFIFATPANLPSIAGALKDFFDRSYYAVLGRINGRPSASLVCAGSDGSNAALQIQRIATGRRLRSVAVPLIVCTHAQTPEEILRAKQIAAADLERCAALGATMASGLALGIF